MECLRCDATGLVEVEHNGTVCDWDCPDCDGDKNSDKLLASLHEFREKYVDMMRQRDTEVEEVIRLDAEVNRLRMMVEIQNAEPA